MSIKTEKKYIEQGMKESHIPFIPIHAITTNHMVQLDSGQWVRISHISNEFFFNSRILTLSNGSWCCLGNNDKVKAVLAQ